MNLRKGISIPPNYPDLLFYKHRGSGGGGQVRHVLGGLMGTLSQTAINTDQLSAWPIVHGGPPISFDTLGIEVTTPAAAGGLIRVGIYSNISPYVMYPDRLLYQSGQIPTDGIAGIYETALNYTLGPGIYWIAHVAGVAVPTLRIVSGGSFCPFYMGFPLTGGATPFRRVVQSTPYLYAPLPDPFPAGCIYDTSGFTLAIPARCVG